jgi:hypothetical protein
MMRSRFIFVALILLLLSGFRTAQTQSNVRLSPADLVKAVIRNELNPSVVTEVHWKYRLIKEVDGKQETREVVETTSASLDRLIAIAGRPLSAGQERDETERILRLSRNSEEQRKLEQAHKKDVEQYNAFFKMVPEAFLFEYTGESGNVVKLIFNPNPAFRPSSREGKVLHELAGEISIDVRQQRLVSIRGHLVNEVKFAGGLLGHLDKGGQFEVKRTEVAPGRWEVTEMDVNMQGKALFFKTISVQQKELHRNFERVPEDLTIAEAAAILLKESLIAARRWPATSQRLEFPSNIARQDRKLP